jgi:23S rRNA (guanosine2251-2'-O)-methyltransferase
MPRRKHFRHKPARPDAPFDQALTGGGRFWIYGYHPVTMALANPRRRVHRLLAVDQVPDSLPRGLLAERTDASQLRSLLPAGAVHQGIALLVDALSQVRLDELLEDLPEEMPARLLLLDQVTDPQNVGAVLRSCAAFGAAGVILTERHAAPETGALAKAASGALEVVPLVRVTNLVRAIETLKQAGFWCLGLAGEAESTLAQATAGTRVALILGAEGAGLRRLTRAHCDQLVRLPTSWPVAQLNVSNAAAVALYELVRGHPPVPRRIAERR